MSDVMTMLNMINDAIFVSLVNTTLQMTLLIPLVLLIIWMFRIKSATTRYSLWLFVLFAIIVLPLITPFIPQIDFARLHGHRATGDVPDELMRLRMGGGDVGGLSESGDSVASMGATNTAANKEANVSIINPVSVAYFIWCAGALCMFCVTIVAHGNLRKLRINSPGVQAPTALEILSQLKQKIRIRRPVVLKASSEIYTPVSVGIFSPTIILPDGVIENSPFPKGGLRGISELEMILTHELAHIKRCDYLINFLQNVLKAIFFFHPLFHLMNRNLAREREHICDDWVIDMTKRRSGYAECIIGLLEKALHKPVNVPVTIAMAERKRDIPGRIEMIVDKKRKITAKVSKKALIAVFLIGCLSLPVIGGIGLVRFARARPASNEGRIVFVRTNSGIWVMDANGKNEQQLTTSWGDGRPAWSPDGKQIVFRREGVGVYIMNADGSNMKQLTDGPDDNFPTWLLDGKQIGFTREVWEQKDGKWEVKSSAIYVMDSDGANLKKLAEKQDQAFYRDPDWSPDGRKTAFYQMSLDSPNKVWVMDADGKNLKMLYKWGQSPTWSPDGRRIVFSSKQAAWNIDRGAHDIYVMDADGANVEILTEPGLSSDYQPAWSPDGTKMVFTSNRDGNWDLYVMGADGSNVQRLTNTPEIEWGADWTAFSYAIEPAGKLKATWRKIKRELFGKESKRLA